MMGFTKTTGLFVVTAIAEILGCYCFYLVAKCGYARWLVLAGLLSLAAFAWLLTLHPILGAGRTYAAYGGVYVATAVMWLWWADGVRPDRWDVMGAFLCVAGTGVIVLGPRHVAGE